MNDIILNQLTPDKQTVSYNYFINVLNARGISLTREQMLTLKEYGNQIPISFLKEFENIGILYNRIPSIDPRYTMLGLKNEKQSRIPQGSPQLPLIYPKCRVNNTLQGVYVPSSMTTDQAYDDENNTRLRLAQMTYKQDPVYNKTSKGTITTGGAFKYISEPMITPNTKSGIFKGMDKSFTFNPDKSDLSGNSITMTPRITTDIKGVTITDINEETQTITVNMNDGSKRISQVRDPNINRDLNNSKSIFRESIPRYEPQQDNIPKLNSSVLKSIYSKINPDTLTQSQKTDIINGVMFNQSPMNTSNSTAYFGSRRSNESTINLNAAASFRSKEINRYVNETNGDIMYRSQRDPNVARDVNMLNMAESMGDTGMSSMIKGNLNQSFGMNNIGMAVSRIIPQNNMNQSMYTSIARKNIGGS